MDKFWQTKTLQAMTSAECELALSGNPFVMVALSVA